jgi:hypothetical protein
MGYALDVEDLFVMDVESYPGSTSGSNSRWCCPRPSTSST